MRQIRKGVFETNSSSVHAICIATNPSEDSIHKTPVKMTFRDFGWEWDLHRDAQTKAEYALTALFESYSHDRDFVVEKVKEFRSWLEEDGLLAEKYWRDLGDATFGITLYAAVGYPEYGAHWYLPEGFYGIDHGSGTREFVDYVFANKERMWNFLFSEDSFVQTGNDNEDYSGINLKDIKYDHETFEKWN